MVILDTCTLLWLAADQGRLSTAARGAIERHSAALFVSAITAFEIAVKCRRGRLELPLPAMDWFTKALDFHGVHELAVTSHIAVASVQLPPLHSDPCDRMIIATAARSGLKIIPCDTLISQYDEADMIW